MSAPRLHRSWLAILLAALLFLAAAPASAHEPVNVRVGPHHARLIGDGQTVNVHVWVRCDPVGEVLEALVTVSQDLAYGEAGFGPVCDGTRHKYKVRVTSYEAPFTRGYAQISAYVLLCDANDDCVSGGDTERVWVKPPWQPGA